MRPAARMPKLTRRSRILIAIALAAVVILLFGGQLIDKYVDWLWFGEMGYRSVCTTVMSRLKLFGIGLPAAIGFFAFLFVQGEWVTVQMFLHGGDFGVADPQFGMDLGFYAFDLPFYRFVLNFLFIATFLAFIANLLGHYLFGGIRLAGRTGALSKS